MPWRWSSWSHIYSQAIEHLEHGRSFIFDPSQSTDDDESSVGNLRVNTNTKKLHKRLDQVREKEMSLEMGRLGLEHLPENEAISYRHLVKKQQ